MSEFGERDAFHAAIWQSPDDDLPRLVYADWLDERDEPDAAAFLRLLCAVRTCPPDVDRLRPLVADFRRAMAKVPAPWIDDVCPVPPAVVVGAWVDVDHEANEAVRVFLRKRRRDRTGLQPPDSFLPVRLASEVSWPSQEVVDRLWGELQPVLSPAAACAIDGVPSLVDVWSGVVMAVAAGDNVYYVRLSSDEFDPIATTPTSIPLDVGVRRWASNELGRGWAFGRNRAAEEGWLRRAAGAFDPANQPG